MISEEKFEEFKKKHKRKEGCSCRIEFFIVNNGTFAEHCEVNRIDDPRCAVHGPTCCCGNTFTSPACPLHADHDEQVLEEDEVLPHLTYNEPNGFFAIREGLKRWLG